MPYNNVVVDISAYAGQNAQFRFRLGSDTSVGAEGWYIDDFKVQGCSASDLIFADGFDPPQPQSPGCSRKPAPLTRRGFFVVRLSTRAPCEAEPCAPVRGELPLARSC